MLVRLSVLALLSGTATAQLFVDVRKQEMPAQWMHTETLFAGDLNGDGWSDVVVGGYSLESSPATTLNNDGHGRLLSGWRGGYFSRVAAVHDMDLDGDLDLVMEFDVAVNDGQGQFTRVSTGSHLPFTSVVTAAAVGDLTGDGLPDIYYARLFVNQGVLQFEPDLGSPSREGFYATGDVDGDGDLDLFAGGSLLANDGTGVFTDVSASLPATVSPYAQVVLQDLDADGDLDVLVGQSPILLLENSGQGVFTDQSHRIVGSGAPPGHLAVGDLDRDGDLDILQGLSVGGLALRNASGQFVADPDFWDPAPTAAGPMVLTDLDRDGDPDLVLGQGAPAWDMQDRLFRNDRGRRLIEVSPPSLSGAANGSGTVALGDVNGDGHPDLVNGPAGRVLVGDGRGGFKDLGHDLGTAGTPLLGDMDGDGDLDLVVFGAGRLVVRKNPGDGRFTALSSSILPSTGRAAGGALGDVDGDGDLDLLLATLNGYPGLGGSLFEPPPDSLWMNDGDGRLSQAALPPIESHSSEVVAGDLDRDGDMDFLTNGGVLYLNNGDGSFSSRSVPLLDLASTLAMGDLDADGDLDLAVGQWCGCFDGAGNFLLFNDGTGQFGDSYPTDRADTETHAAVIGDVDGDGDADIVFGNVETPEPHPLNDLVLNDGMGGFYNTRYDGVLPEDLDDTEQVFLVDLDGDRDLDLIAINQPRPYGSQVGSSKVYVNLTRHLRAPYLPRMGYAYPLEVHGAERGAAVFISLAPSQILIEPFGVVGLDPASTHLFTLLDRPAQGRVANLEVIIPRLPALIGLQVYLQALVFGPTLLESRLTNTLREELVSY